jgi:hypothetical protein
MALVCRNCYADVSDDIQFAKPKTPYKCKCGSTTFIDQPDDPTVVYTLTVADRKLLRRLGIQHET